MSTMASPVTGVSFVYSAVCSGADKRKHQSSASLAFMRWIHRWPVNSPHKWPGTRKMLPFDDVIMPFTEAWGWMYPSMNLPSIGSITQFSPAYCSLIGAGECKLKHNFPPQEFCSGFNMWNKKVVIWGSYHSREGPLIRWLDVSLWLCWAEEDIDIEMKQFILLGSWLWNLTTVDIWTSK